MKISILTLFPDMFSGPFQASIVKNALDRQLVSIDFVNIRDFGIGPHKIVDDTPYGGGIGMVMRVDVLKKALEATRDPNLSQEEEKVVLLTADGETYNQRVAESFAQLKHLILLCGHYEGVDERIRQFVDVEVSIGDFVLTGGEIPAMLITDSVVRLLKGVLKEGVTNAESFSHKDEDNFLLEYPQYTRPQEFAGLAVPEILSSGNHQKIDAWRQEQAKKKTALKRPDLLRGTKTRSA
ncbi:MAG TPA: tRNA (guanosine(37)-N1)-methyltransferase TrmD [Patescibacteria group bacterium]|nr:tRNA (guanosine(37)-N1)-methyltransferase TrmD [Patescibacteria group bacterium]